MRSLLLTFSFFVLVGLFWAVEGPLAALLGVKTLEDSTADRAQCMTALAQAGPGAALALEEGLRSPSTDVRLRCARVLAYRGDNGGLNVLLETLREHGGESDALGALAEAYLISVWDERDGPPLQARRMLHRLAFSDAEIQLAELTELLEKYPAWTGGYVRRGQLYQAKGDVLEIRREALMALTVQPQNFEALTLLATAYLRLNAPKQAYTCLDQATRINPRLKHTHAELIQQTIKALNTDRERRRREKRRETPVAFGQKAASRRFCICAFVPSCLTQRSVSTLL